MITGNFNEKYDRWGGVAKENSPKFEPSNCGCGHANGGGGERDCSVVFLWCLSVMMLTGVWD